MIEVLIEKVLFSINFFVKIVIKTNMFNINNLKRGQDYHKNTMF